MKIAVCDDERAVCRQIKDLTEAYLQVKGIQGECETFNVYQQLQGRESEFDLFLLDYKMPDINGLEFARKLYEKHGEKKTIVFITAYPEIVYDAFEVRAYRFLVKPVESEKLNSVLDACVERYRAQYYLSVLSDGRTEVIPLEKILYVEVMRKDCTIVLEDRTVVCHKTIAAFEEEMTPFDFFRVHRAYLVNMRKIRSYDSRIIQLDNGEKIFMGPKKYSDFCKAYIKLLK